MTQIHRVIYHNGENLAWHAAASLLHNAHFQNQSGINAVLTPINKLDEATAANYLFTDPIYGLNNASNYHRWNGFLNNATEKAAHLLELELKTYFGLEDSQISEIRTNWDQLMRTQFL